MQAEVKELVELRQMIAQFDAGHENTVGPLKARCDALQAKITEELKGLSAGIRENIQISMIQ